MRFEFALLNDWNALCFKAVEPSVYEVRLNYPPFWKTLAPREKRAKGHDDRVQSRGDSGYSG